MASQVCSFLTGDFKWTCVNETKVLSINEKRIYKEMNDVRGDIQKLRVTDVTAFDSSVLGFDLDDMLFDIEEELDDLTQEHRGNDIDSNLWLSYFINLVDSIVEEDSWNGILYLLHVVYSQHRPNTPIPDSMNHLHNRIEHLSRLIKEYEKHVQIKVQDKHKKIADLLEIEASLEIMWKNADKAFREREKVVHLCKTLENCSIIPHDSNQIYQLEF